MELPNTCNGNAILQHIRASALPTQPLAAKLKQTVHMAIRR